MIDFLKRKLMKKYPKLAEYLLKFNKELNKFRTIEAHEIPDNIEFSEDEDLVYIPRAGNLPPLKMNLSELSKILCTYIFFIDSLGIY